MGKKGKGRKRREANFKASHPDAAPHLAPPPSSKDVIAVPAKLRRIMKFKETGVPGNVHAATIINHNKNRSKEPRDSKEAKEGSKSSKGTKGDSKNATKDNSKKPTSLSNSDRHVAVDGEVAEKPLRPLGKRNREHEELLQLAEKIKANPARTGIKERRKKYLEEKKKKRLKSSAYETSLNAPEHERIAFGDIVQEPPKLSFPEKAKITMKEARPVSHERIRLQAIEAYRERKGAVGTRLGRGPPVLEETTGL